MAKRRRGPARPPEVSRAALAAVQRPRSTRTRRQPPPPANPNRNLWIAGGGVAVIAVLLIGAYFLRLIPGFGPAAGGGTGTAPTCTIPPAGRASAPPEQTPLASPPDQPVSDGTTATIVTDKGTIVINLYCGSSPVAAQNFVNLASAGFYNGLTFHRTVPDFVIQGGDPNGNGSGGPGYEIQDEKVVGTYGRGTVAMARTQAPNSQGSQFFIVVSDQARAALESANTYAIFGDVTQGMDVVDQIVSAPTQSDGETPVTPVKMTSVTVQAP
jgi:peptidyl-prolyl cis-trans isomerase B (cyclophilin B)